MHTCTILPMALTPWCCYCHHITREESEAQRDSLGVPWLSGSTSRIGTQASLASARGPFCEQSCDALRSILHSTGQVSDLGVQRRSHVVKALQLCVANPGIRSCFWKYHSCLKRPVASLPPSRSSSLLPSLPPSLLPSFLAHFLFCRNTPYPL